MLLLVMFVKLVADWSKVYWMPSFRQCCVWGLLLIVPLDATIVVSVRVIARTAWVLYLSDQCCSQWFGEVVVVYVVYPPKAGRGCGPYPLDFFTSAQIMVLEGSRKNSPIV